MAKVGCLSSASVTGLDAPVTMVLGGLLARNAGLRGPAKQSVVPDCKSFGSVGEVPLKGLRGVGRADGYGRVTEGIRKGYHAVFCHAAVATRTRVPLVCNRVLTWVDGV